jgi:CheY-like chemotaxis protein
MDRKKILIVDDDGVTLKRTSILLADNGYDVVTAKDGAEAVAKARHERPDLILLDLLFPPDVSHGGGVGWDGFLILSWLRRIDEALHTPVIMMSVTDPAKHVARAQASGVRAFFHKPLQNEALLEAIRKVLGSQMPGPRQEGQRRKRILFVDDEGDWRMVAGTYLEDAGFEVVTAKDIAEALHRMERIKLDAIVLDVQLGKENGLLLMEFLKKSHPGVPILVYTGQEHGHDVVQEMLKQGASRYLRKGTMGELCEAVRQATN